MVTRNVLLLATIATSIALYFGVSVQSAIGAVHATQAQEQGQNPDMGDREGVPPSAGSGSR